MAINNKIQNLIRTFVKNISTDKEQTSDTGTVYGTVVVSDGTKQVRLDGATEPTACLFNVEADEGDRVVCSVQNHSWSVDSNVTKPASSPTTEKGRSDVESIIDEKAGSLSGIDVYYQTAEPTAPSGGFKDGDTWYELDANGYAVALKVWKTNQWVSTQFDGGNIIRANSITGNEIAVNKLSAISADLGDITAGTITGITLYSGDIYGTYIEGSTVTVTDGDEEVTLSDKDGLYATYGYIKGLTIDDCTVNSAKIKNATITTATVTGLTIGDNFKMSVKISAGRIMMMKLESDRMDMGVYSTLIPDWLSRIHFYTNGQLRIESTKTTMEYLADINPTSGYPVNIYGKLTVYAGLNINDHDSDIGTVVNAISNSDNYSCPTGAWTVCGGSGGGYYKVPAGSWVVTVRASFSSNSTGRRGIRITNNAGSTYGSAMSVIPAASSGGVTVSTSTVLTLSAAENIKIELYQDSGSKLTVTTRSMRIVRIA